MPQLKIDSDAELQKELSWMTQPLHGVYHWVMEKATNVKKSYQYLEKAGLGEITEIMIMAAQEQALSIRSIDPEVYHFQ